MTERNAFGEIKMVQNGDAQNHRQQLIVPDVATLSKIRKECESAMSNFRMALETVVDTDSGVKAAWKIISKIKALMEFRDKKVEYRSREGIKAREQISKLIEALIKNVSLKESVIPDSADGRKIKDILMHYRANELSDDKSLAEDFDKVRAEYQKNPKDSATSIRFGWMLYDCLKAACERLHNVKLTEYFKKHFEEWSYQGEDSKRDGRLDKQRDVMLRKATAFLSGPRDALQYAAAGQWEKCVAAGTRYLEGNPGSKEAFDVLVRALGNLDKPEYVAKAPVVLEQAMDWFPNEIQYQRKFVYAVSQLNWMLFKSVKESSNLAERKQILEAYVQIVHVMSERVGQLTMVGPGIPEYAADYSKILDVTTFAVERIWWLTVKNSRYRSVVAEEYSTFVRKWGIRNLRKEDREEHIGERVRLSLAGRMVLTLLKCACYGIEHDEDSWLMKVAQKSFDLFRRDPSLYYNALAALYHEDGDEERSRKYALMLVRHDQSEGWRWRVLARTYPKDSQEAADCKTRAQSKEERESLKVFAELFASIPVQDKNVNIVPAPVGESKAESVDSSDEVYLAACQRAEKLIEDDVFTVRGQVITRFMDKVTGSEMLRVWWRNASGVGLSDFVKLPSDTRRDGLTAGDPVFVSVSDEGERFKVVRVERRNDGAEWDVYPYRMAVVSDRDDGHRYATITYDRGKRCSVNLRKMLDAQELRPGDLCSVALFEREGMSPIVLDVKGTTGKVENLAFCRVYSGLLERVKNKREGRVGNVVVPHHVRGDVWFGSQVTGLCVDVGRSADGDAHWSAITCKSISNDLEVLQ